MIARVSPKPCNCKLKVFQNEVAFSRLLSTRHPYYNLNEPTSIALLAQNARNTLSEMIRYEHFGLYQRSIWDVHGRKVHEPASYQSSKRQSSKRQLPLRFLISLPYLVMKFPTPDSNACSYSISSAYQFFGCFRYHEDGTERSAS